VTLGLRIIPAKRGKFTLIVVDWALWDPAKNDLVPDSDPAPKTTAWLAVTSSLIIGANYRLNMGACVLLLITEHAIIRLSQRADVRTIGDLLVLTGELWQAAVALIDKHPDDRWLNPPDGAWTAPIRQGTINAVLEPDRSGARRLVVKTVLNADMT
jgi:hypothetical protein